MARSLSEIAAKTAKEFARIENVYVKDALMLTGVSADTDLSASKYIWASMYFYDTTKGIRENIDALACVELDSGDTVYSLVDFAKAKGFIASNEKPLNIVCYKSRIPLRYRKYSSSNNSSINVDELL